MKRFITLMLAFALVISAVATSSATEMSVKGQMNFGFEWNDNVNFYDSDEDGQSEDDFEAYQRVRTQINFAASENLEGVLFFEIGTQSWGDVSDGADSGTDGVNIETRRAYIDFQVPSSELNVRMGLQGIALPSTALGNPVLDTDMAGIVLTHPIGEMAEISAFWARLDNVDGDDNQVNGVPQAGFSQEDQRDVFAVTVALDFDTIKVTPYAAYAAIGGAVNGSNGVTVNNTFEDVDAYWLGFAFEADIIENLFFDLDFVYGSADSDEEADEADGWQVATKLGYKMDMFTPVLMGWYGTGNDDGANDESELMPVLGSGTLGATHFGTDGAYYDSQATALSADGRGTWGIGVALEDISFMEDLTHVVRLVYITGTNDEDAANNSIHPLDVFLTEDDHAFEVNFDTEYQIYENLTAVVELGWINVDFDDDRAGRSDDTSDAWKAAFTFSYSF